MALTRRKALAAIAPAAVVAALALAGCQTGTPRDASGASGSGFAHLVEIRSGAGLPALTPDAKLERAALRQAGYMAGASKMNHDTGWGRDFASRMKKDGVSAPAAENLAHGRMDTKRLFRMWMDSSGHRRNMLDERFGRYGLAYATASDGQRYWALVLGK